MREYIRVLRLLEKHTMGTLRQAVEKALEHGAITRDAVVQFLYPREEERLQTFDQAGHPHLKHVRVQAPDLNQYTDLMASA